MAPTFVTPLPQSSRSDILEWSFPKPNSHLVLRGKSRAAWSTSFVIPQLSLLLDAGLCVDNHRPKHIFLTHGHSDHVLLAPAFVNKDDRPDFYCPAEMKDTFDAFVIAKVMLNLGMSLNATICKDGAKEARKAEADPAGAEEKRPIEEGEDQKLTIGTGPGPHSSLPASSSSSEPKITQPLREPLLTISTENACLQTHITHGLAPGTTISLRRRPNVTATALSCIHTVPTLGYVFAQTSRRLKPQYRGLSGPELGALRKSSSVEITEPHSMPLFAFLGDTTAAVFSPPSCASSCTSSAEDSGSGVVGAMAEWLERKIPVVITECSFLYPGHEAQGQKTMHTTWADLEPVVRRHPETTFVLIHFSLRYSDGDIRAFFRDMEGGCPGNVVVWADGDGD